MTYETTYNGWKNYETWNVSLWINNDYENYKQAQQIMMDNPTITYKELMKIMVLPDDKTPDGVDWLSDDLAYDELNEMVKELAQ